MESQTLLRAGWRLADHFKPHSRSLQRAASASSMKTRQNPIIRWSSWDPSFLPVTSNHRSVYGQNGLLTTYNTTFADRSGSERVCPRQTPGSTWASAAVFGYSLGRPHESPLVMDARPATRRSSLGSTGTIAPEPQPSRPSSSRSKRHSWAFRGYTAPRPPQDAPPKLNREPDSLLAPPSVKRSRSSPSAPPGHSRSAPSSRDQSPEPTPARPRTSHGFKLRVPNFSRTLPERGSTLPTIMEQKGARAADSLRSRVAGSKVKQWDGRTRTNVPWDGLRRVGFAAENGLRMDSAFVY